MEKSEIVRDGRLVARVCGWPDADAKTRAENPGLSRYTVFTKDQDGEWAEEVDVDAINTRLARECASLELAQGYEPGLKIARVEERFGLYF